MPERFPRVTRLENRHSGRFNGVDEIDTEQPLILYDQYGTGWINGQDRTSGCIGDPLVRLRFFVLTRTWGRRP